jgi:formylglycine-generating enzyme required for sulfatase activity
VSALVRTTRDAYIGLDNPSPEAWRAWHHAMLDERASVRARSRIDLAAYADLDTAWSDTSFRQVFLFMYDASFYDREARHYRMPELVERWTTMFGRVDSVLLWHAYPRLGFDARAQFDFYRDMPGGLAQLRAQVSDVLHRHGIRVFIDYNPWAAGTYEELAEIVAALDADGVMLDTMAEAPEHLARTVERRRKGVVLAPERTPRDEDLGRLRQSWAQWHDVGDASTPSIPRHRWIVPQHRQLTIRRWDTSRKQDIVYAFFNGSGLIVWDDIFGTWNPYDRQDRRLIAETAAVLDGYQDLVVYGEWLPLVPTGVSGLDANRWNETGGGGRALVALRNRTKERVHYRVPADAPPGLTYVSFWGDDREGGGREHAAGDTVAVEPEGVQALVLDEPARARAHVRALSVRADAAHPDYDERCPRPRLTRFACSGGAPAASGLPEGPATRMIDLPAGAFTMRIRHDRRECGCYPAGATDDAMWGWFYKDVIVHEIPTTLNAFAIRATAVTNAEYLAFVRVSGYRPDAAERFLAHIARREDGSLPAILSDEQGSLPVTFVSLADAQAYAAWRGERLPTEAEWQWAAEGAGAGHRYPWGNDERSFPVAIRPALDPATATPQGVMGMAGNTWELTESEHTDGHTRFVMLRGGVFLPPGESEWLPARGVRPNDSHAKYLLLSDGLDRSDTISFRTVMERSCQ